MKNFRWLWIVGCLLWIGACDRSSPESSTDDSKPKVTLQLNWKPEPQFGGFYAAQVNGAYARHNLEVEIKEGGAGVPTVDMLAAGTVPFAIVSGDEIIVARSLGKPIVALFAAYQTHPQGIMSRASRGFKEIGDVFRNEGTLAMEQGLPYSDFLKKKYGFDKLKVVPSPFGDLSVFRNDEKYSMQCFVTSEPLAARRIGIEPAVFLIADSGYNPYATVLATSDSYLQNNRSTVKSMVLAVREGWEAYLKDPAATNAAMSKLNPTMDAQTFAESAAAQIPLIESKVSSAHRLGHMSLERWQTLANQLHELNVVNKAIPPAECFVDPSTWTAGN
jgi:NitT/TauT family transport system substrate-binding protein